MKNFRAILWLVLLGLVLGGNSSLAAMPSLEAGRKHWAFQPLATAKVPVAKDAAWARNDVDRFILAALEAKGLKPSPEADRRTLIRRVTFDLTGLPPTPEEVEAFVQDKSPQAWERVVDRLLASPHYGERWGRHWLDLARYADSSGFHNDLDRPHAWRYRDYVIRSFDEDKPYARFIAEQLAGDEVAGANEETLVATGFCRNAPSNDDNMGVNKEQYRLDELDDVISTTATVFLGLTVGCARCHDHKTDPIRSADYYSLLAVFNGTEKRGVPKESDDKERAKLNVNLQALIETKSAVPATFLLRRGSLQNKGPEVPPAAPLVLTASPLRFPEPEPGAKSSGRRRTFAEWVAAPENPLTWRVLANRIWQHHFGRGLEQLRLPRRAPHAPGVARFPRGPAHRGRRAVEAVAQVARDVGDVSAELLCRSRREEAPSSRDPRPETPDPI
jgi:hypothetical protein